MIEGRLDRHEPHNEAGGLAPWIVQAIFSRHRQVFLWVIKANQAKYFSEYNSVLPLNLFDPVNGPSLHPRFDDSVVVLEEAEQYFLRRW